MVGREERCALALLGPFRPLNWHGLLSERALRERLLRWLSGNLLPLMLFCPDDFSLLLLPRMTSFFVLSSLPPLAVCLSDARADRIAFSLSPHRRKEVGEFPSDPRREDVYAVAHMATCQAGRCQQR